MSPDTGPQAPAGDLPLAPWVLVDDDTIDQTAMLLERLTRWLQTEDTPQTRACADALSLGETDDPESLAAWIDCLAARLRRCAEGKEL